MVRLLPVTTIVVLLRCVAGFTVTTTSGRGNLVGGTAARELRMSESGVESEVEKLRRKARELRAEAESSRLELRTTQLEKKDELNRNMDRAIQDLFGDLQNNLNNNLEDGDNAQDIEKVVRRLKKNRSSTEQLKRIVVRLHQRTMAARGLKRVDTLENNNGMEFALVESPVNSTESAWTHYNTELLVNATKVLDEEFWAAKRVSNDDWVVHYADSDHYTTGDVSKILQDKLKNLNREHDDQWKNKLKKDTETATRKKRPKVRKTRSHPSRKGRPIITTQPQTITHLT